MTFTLHSNRLFNGTHSTIDRQRERGKSYVKGEDEKRKRGDRKTAEGSTGNPFKKSNKVHTTFQDGK